MKRVLVLSVLIAVSGLSLIVAAQQPGASGQQAPRVVEVQQVKDNLYVLTGGGGNTAVFITANGVVVVDTKNPGWGQPLLEKIKTLTDKPVTTIINTHTHGDHVSGNVEFPATVDIVTHENTRANMEKMIPNSSSQNQTPPTTTIFQENGGRGLPKTTFKDTMTLGQGDDRIDLYYFGRGHTNGDAWILFPSLRVVHAGDIFSGKNIPLLDSNNGGSAIAMPGTLQKAHDSLTEVDSIITGHSTLMTRADLREYVDFNRDFLNAVREAKQAGRAVDEVVSSWKMPAKYVGYAEPNPARVRNNVALVYREVDAGGSR